MIYLILNLPALESTCSKGFRWHLSPTTDSLTSRVLLQLAPHLRKWLSKPWMSYWKRSSRISRIWVVFLVCFLPSIWWTVDIVLMNIPKWHRADWTPKQMLSWPLRKLSLQEPPQRMILKPGRSFWKSYFKVQLIKTSKTLTRSPNKNLRASKTVTSNWVAPSPKNKSPKTLKKTPMKSKLWANASEMMTKALREMMSRNQRISRMIRRVRMGLSRCHSQGARHWISTKSHSHRSTLELPTKRIRMNQKHWLLRNHCWVLPSSIRFLKFKFKPHYLEEKSKKIMKKMSKWSKQKASLWEPAMRRAKKLKEKKTKTASWRSRWTKTTTKRIIASHKTNKYKLKSTALRSTQIQMKTSPLKERQMF